MREVLIELLEPLAILAYAILAGALTLGGIALEVMGLSGATSGTLELTTLWPAYMGVVALFFGFLVARDKLLPRLRAVTS